MNTTKDYTINAVHKALVILKLFEKHDDLSLLEISALTGIGKSSALRLLYTLHQERFIAFDEKSKRYSLGLSVFQLGIRKYDTMDYRKIVLPLLKEMADETGLICYLGVKMENTLAMIDKVFPRTVPTWAQLMAQAGGAIQLCSTGIGRLFLAQLTDAEIKDYLDRLEIRRFTPDTITDKHRIFELILEARRDGVSHNLGENEPYIVSICAPIYNHDGVMLAGVSICGMKEVIFGPDYGRYRAMLLNAAERTSRELGYEGRKS